MSVTSGRGKLEEARKDLLRNWQHTRQFWNDPVAERFELKIIVPIDRKITSALPSLDMIADLLRRARRECE